MDNERSTEVRCRYRRCRHCMPRVWQPGCEAHCYLHNRASSQPDRIRQTFEI